MRDMIRFRMGPIIHKACNRAESRGDARTIELLAKLAGMLRSEEPAAPVPVQWSRETKAAPKPVNKEPDSGPGTIAPDTLH